MTSHDILNLLRAKHKDDVSYLGMVGKRLETTVRQLNDLKEKRL